MKKKRLSVRIVSVSLVVVMLVLMLPVGVFAWSSKTHNYAANLIIDELLENRVEQVKSRSHRKTYKYYLDIPPLGKFSVPNEFADAIIDYPEAFRAGSLGPDFYPDILTGQGSIHPIVSETNKKGSVNIESGEWLELMFDKLNSMPQNSPERKEGLSFTLGYMFHYCGDMFGHDFINSFVGAEFPSVMDMPKELVHDNALFNRNLTTILRHMSAESYMDSLVNEKYTKKECATAFYIMLDKLMSDYGNPNITLLDLRRDELGKMLDVFDGEDENFKILNTEKDNIFFHFVEDTALEAYYCDCNVFDIRLIGDRFADDYEEAMPFSHRTIDYGSNDVAVIEKDVLDRTAAMVGKLDSLLSVIGEDMIAGENHDMSSESAALALAEYQKKFYGATSSTPVYVLQAADILNFENSILVDLKEKKTYGLDAAPGLHLPGDIFFSQPWSSYHAMICNLLGMQQREDYGDGGNFKDEVDDVLRWIATNPMGASEENPQSQLKLNGAVFTDDTFVFPYIMMNPSISDVGTAVAITIFVKTNGEAYALVSNTSDLLMTSDYPNDDYRGNKMFIMGRCALMDSHPGYTRIDAPAKFVAESLYFDGTMDGDIADPFKRLRRIGEMPKQINFFIDLRQSVYSWAQEHREDDGLAGIVAFADEWVADMDNAMLGLIDTIDEITQELVALPEIARRSNESKRLTWEADSMFTVVKRNLGEWWSDCGIYALPIPDFIIDTFGIIGDIADAIASDPSIRRIKEDSGLDNLGADLDVFKSMIVDELVTWLVKELTNIDLETVKNSISDPRINYSPEEFEALKKSFMNFGESESTFDQECAAFYNTIIMMKIILIGPGGLKNLIKRATGMKDYEYNNAGLSDIVGLGEGVPKANRLMVEVKTGDIKDAGTDADISFIVGDKNNAAYQKKSTVDKHGYNDLERGDFDTYFFPVGKNLRVEDINFKIRMDSCSSDIQQWYCEYVTVTPYNGDIQVGDKAKYRLDEWFTYEGEVTKVYGLAKPGGDYCRYTTNVGDYLMRIIGFVDKLDGSRQWIDKDNLLYSKAVTDTNDNSPLEDMTPEELISSRLREQVFFKVFKGFDPIITMNTPTYDFNTMKVSYSFEVTPRMNGLTSDLRRDDGTKSLSIRSGYITITNPETGRTAKSELVLARGKNNQYITGSQLLLDGKPGEIQKIVVQFSEERLFPQNAACTTEMSYLIKGPWFETDFNGRFPYGDHDITIRNAGTERAMVGAYFENDIYDAFSVLNAPRYVNPGQSVQFTIHANFDQRLENADVDDIPNLVITNCETGRICQRIPTRPHMVLVADDSESYVSMVNGKAVPKSSVVTVKCGDAVTLNAVNVNEYTGEGIDYGWMLGFDRVSILAESSSKRSFLPDSIGQSTYTITFDETGIYEFRYTRRTSSGDRASVTKNVVIINVTDNVSADVKNVNVSFNDGKEYYSYTKPEPFVSVDGEHVDVSRLTVAGKPFGEYIDSVYRTSIKYGHPQDEYSVIPSTAFTEVYGYLDGAYTKFIITFETATFTVWDAYESNAVDLSDLGLQFVWDLTDNVFPPEYVPEYYRLESNTYSFGLADIETGEKYYGKIPTRMLEIEINDGTEYFVMFKDDEGNITFYATDKQLCEKYGYQHINTFFDYNQHTNSYINGRMEVPISCSSGIYRVASIWKPIISTNGICEPVPVGGLAEIKVNYDLIKNLNIIMKDGGYSDRYYFSHWNIPEGIEVVKGDMYSETIVILVPDVLTLSIGMEMKSSATVSFDANEGTGTMAPVAVSGTSEFTLPQNGFTAPAGDYFIGWRVQYDETGTVYIPGDIIEINRDLEIYPLWGMPSDIQVFRANGDAKRFIPKTDASVQIGTGLGIVNSRLLPAGFTDFSIVGDLVNDNCWYTVDGENLVYYAGISSELTFQPDTAYALKLQFQIQDPSRCFNDEFINNFMYADVAASSMEVIGDIANVTWIFPKTQERLTGTLEISGVLKHRNTLEAVLTNTNASMNSLMFEWWVDDGSRPALASADWGTERTFLLTSNTIGQTVHCRVSSRDFSGYIEASSSDVIQPSGTDDAPSGFTVMYSHNGIPFVSGLNNEMEMISVFDKNSGSDYWANPEELGAGIYGGPEGAMAIPAGAYYVRYRANEMEGIPASQETVLRIKRPFIIDLDLLIESAYADGEYERNMSGGFMQFNGDYGWFRIEDQEAMNESEYFDYGYKGTDTMVGGMIALIPILEGDTVTIQYVEPIYDGLPIEISDAERFPVHLATWASEEGYVIEIVDNNTIRITMPVYDDETPIDGSLFAEDFNGQRCTVDVKFDRCNVHFEDRDMCFDYDNISNYCIDTFYHYGTCADCGKNIAGQHTGGNPGEVASCTDCGHVFGYAEHDCNEFRQLVPGWSDEYGHYYICSFCHSRDYFYSPSSHFGGDDTVCGHGKSCLICGFEYTEPLIDHDFTVHGHNDTHHWMECATCGEIDPLSLAEHTAYIPADCIHKAICGDCGEEYGEPSGEHSGGIATCSERAVCDICHEEYGKLLAHTFANGIMDHNETHHWEVCDDCGAAGKLHAHEGGTATCVQKAVCAFCEAEYGGYAPHSGGVATCTELAVCSSCGNEYGEFKHELGDYEPHDDTQHKQVCSECGDIHYQSHMWNSGEVTTEATIGVPGEITYTCVSCSATKTESIPAVNTVVYLESADYAVNGRTMTATLSIEGTYDGYSFSISAPAGMRITNVATANSSIVASLKSGKWQIAVMPGLNRVNAEKTLVATVTFEVAEDFALGNIVMGLDDISVSDTHGDPQRFVEFRPANVRVTDHIEGDVNDDGTFNYYDISKLYVYSAGTEAYDPERLEYIDITGDGNVNYFDVMELFDVYNQSDEN